MAIKELNFDQMKIKLGAVIHERPDLARLILSGQTRYSEGAETFALRGSPAAVTRDLPASVVQASHSPSMAPAGHQELAQEIRAEMATERQRGAESNPPASSAQAQQESAPKPEAPHTKIAARLEGQTSEAAGVLKLDHSRRLTQHRAAQAARSVGHVQGKQPSKLASRIEKLGGAA